MLKADQIRQQIDARRGQVPWARAVEQALGRLDAQTRMVGQLLLGLPEGKSEPGSIQAAQRAHQQGLAKLAKLGDERSLELARALFPRLAHVLPAAWKSLERLPIQIGWQRKPFRAPGRPDLLKPARLRFLSNLMSNLHGIDEDLPWIAAHAPYLHSYSGSDDLGVLLAAAIDTGQQAEEIQEVLRASAEGRHEIGQMGRHVLAAFLTCEQRECWEYIEKLLLTAQREEGLRQVILESVDFAHPDAFRRMLRVIVENNLTRFSATVRAADVWLGLHLDSQSARYVHDTLARLRQLLDDENARAQALAGNDAEAAYLALWSIAFDDAPAAIAPAQRLLDHRKPELRFVAVQLLGMLDIPDAFNAVAAAVDDADLRVATYATQIATNSLTQRMYEQQWSSRWDDDGAATAAVVSAGHAERGEPLAESGDLFERLERLYPRLPARPGAAQAFVWPWVKIKPARQIAADALVTALGKRPRSSVLPYLERMSPPARQWVATLLRRAGELDEPVRMALLKLLGDPSASVREQAVNAARELKVVRAADLAHLEGLLARKGDDLRRAVLGLILGLDDAAVLASAERLLAARGEPQRLAGLDLLQQMQTAQRAPQRVRAVAEAYRARRAELSRDERVYLDNLAAAPRAAATLDDALGLMDPAQRTPPTPPQARDVKLATPAARKLIQLLDEAVHQRRETVVTLKHHLGPDEQTPLGAIQFDFHLPCPYETDRETGHRTLRPTAEFPLWDTWIDIWSRRPSATRDADGLETARALLICSVDQNLQWSRIDWFQDVARSVLGERPKIRYRIVVSNILEWLTVHAWQGNPADFAIDGLETLLAAIPRDKLTIRSNFGDAAFRTLLQTFNVLTLDLVRLAQDRQQWTPEHRRRLFGLQRWIDEPLSVAAPPARGLAKVTKAVRNLLAAPQGDSAPPTVSRCPVDWDVLLDAFAAGWANEHDVYDHLLGPRITRDGHTTYGRFRSFADAPVALRKGELPPPVAQIVQRALDRVLEIELARGEAETAATQPALALRYAGGVDVLVRVLAAIGREPKLKRTSSWYDRGQGKLAVYSHLVRVTMPARDDTPAAFAQTMQAAAIPEDVLLAVAVYAPQWARFVEHAVGWNLLAEAVWWLHAHTKDSQWRVDAETRESWNAEIRRLTPLTLEDLLEGAVDVDWFQRVYGALGEKRWRRLDDYAKYASGGAGHKRAQLFADAMLGKLTSAALTHDIQTKRKQDAVRALGLLPLGNAPKTAVLERYQLMQEFVRTSRQFGSQRQASEKLAARIGQENLARTAGYPDPVRLQWAMEGLATADLARGPVTATVGDVSVQLALDADGLPEISVRRGDRELKSIPADTKKNPAVQELTERKTELRRSASRMRQSLELAMCRGDRFRGDELAELLSNPILRPMLERLVFVGEGVLGYPVAGGKGLRDHAGKVEPVRKSESLRLAHPADLLATRAWTQWQRDCYAAERIQPFKQVFRELYLLTEQEKSDGTFSRRYAGHQVNPRQALALLAARGWITAPEAGIFRTFHDEKLVAWLEFMEPFFTPADVEGLTLEKVRFARRGAEEALPLVDVPQRLFSETLRDVDLVVSVAHRGGVDPEASASTVELRAALLREMLQLLKLDNVRLAPPHAHIRGSRAEYSVHLGSATTHMLPGGALFLVPVHSQHRGRIFLPFADDDPKTAEVLSKVLLLARDEEIKDPNLLNQMRAAAP